MIALAVANYAVSASYLGRETRLSRKRMERKEVELLTDLQDLRKKPLIDEVKKKIKDSETQRNKLRTRIFLLSWLGAVVLPSMFSFLSFGVAVVGMNSETVLADNPQFLEQQSLIFSIGATAIGFMVLFVVIKAVDSAARQIPLPKFKINFKNQMKKEKFKIKEKREVTLCVENDGEDIAEDVLLFFMFPPKFEVQPFPGYRIVEQLAGSDYPSYKAAVFDVEKLHIDVSLVVKILLSLPEDKEIYTIPISIYERKSGKQIDELVIEVVD